MSHRPLHEVGHGEASRSRSRRPVRAPGLVARGGLLLALLFVVPSAFAADYLLKTRPAVADAAVVVNGRSVGTTDPSGQIAIEGFEPGTYTVRVELGGAVLADAVLEFDPEINVVVVPVAGEPSPAVDPEPEGEQVDYIVDTNVGGAEVFVDGRLVTHTGSQDAGASVRLVIGRSYAIRVSKAGFVPAEQRITASDVGNRVRLVLAPVPGGNAASPAAAAHGRLPLPLLVVAALVVVAGGVLALVLLRQRRDEGPRVPAPEGREDEKARTPISFDQYRVSGTLGHGGVATIYRAVDSASGGPVALKILDAKWMGDPEMVQKFLSEAEAIRAIHRVDPEVAVVRVSRSGREGDRLDGRPFMALELLDGETLEAVLDRSRVLPEAEALAIGYYGER